MNQYHSLFSNLSLTNASIAGVWRQLMVDPVVNPAVVGSLIGPVPAIPPALSSRFEFYLRTIRREILSSSVTAYGAGAEIARNFGYAVYTAADRDHDHAVAAASRIVSERNCLVMMIDKHLREGILSKFIVHDYYGGSRLLNFVARIVGKVNRLLGITNPRTYWFQYQWYRPILTDKDMVEYSSLVLSLPSTLPSHNAHVLLTDIYHYGPHSVCDIPYQGNSIWVIRQFYGSNAVAGVNFNTAAYLVRSGVVSQRAGLRTEPWIAHKDFFVDWEGSSSCSTSSGSISWVRKQYVSDYEIIQCFKGNAPIHNNHSLAPIEKALVVRRTIETRWGSYCKSFIPIDIIPNFLKKYVLNREYYVLRKALPLISASKYKTRQAYQITTLTSQIMELVKDDETSFMFHCLSGDLSLDRVVQDTLDYVLWSSVDMEHEILKEALSTYGSKIADIKEMKKNMSAPTASLPKATIAMGALVIVGALLGKYLMRVSSGGAVGCVSGIVTSVEIPASPPDFMQTLTSGNTILREASAVYIAFVGPFLEEYVKSRLPEFCWPLVGLAEFGGSELFSLMSAKKPHRGYLAALGLFRMFMHWFMTKTGGISSHLVLNISSVILTFNGTIASKIGAWVLPLLLYKGSSGLLINMVLRLLLWKTFGTYDYIGELVNIPRFYINSLGGSVEAVEELLKVSLPIYKPTYIKDMESTIAKLYEDARLAYQTAHDAKLEQMKFQPGVISQAIGNCLHTVTHFYDVDQLFLRAKDELWRRDRACPQCLPVGSLPVVAGSLLTAFIANSSVKESWIENFLFHMDIEVPDFAAIDQFELDYSNLEHVKKEYDDISWIVGRALPAYSFHEGEYQGLYPLLATQALMVRPHGHVAFDYAYSVRNLAHVRSDALSECEVHCDRRTKRDCPLGLLWKEVQKLWNQVITKDRVLVLGPEEYMTLQDWVKHFGTHAKKVRAENAVGRIKEGLFSDSTVCFLKSDETLYPKDDGLGLYIKPRVIQSVSPDLQATAARDIDKGIKMLKTLFNRWTEYGSHWGVFTLTIGSGMTNVKLDKWFNECLDRVSASLHNYASFIIAGDDFFGIVKQDGVIKFYENDFSKFDRTQGIHALEHEYHVLKKMGIDRSVITKIKRVNWKTPSYVHPITKEYVMRPAPIQRFSGGPDTTLGNNINHVGSILYVMDQSDMTGIKFELMEELGFESKLQILELNQGPTFLKGWWIPHGELFHWYPLPSQMIKLGKIITNPVDIYKVEPLLAHQMAAKGMALSFPHVPSHYPIFGIFLYKLKNLTTAKVDLIPRSEYAVTCLEIKDDEDIDYSFALGLMTARYGFSPDQVEDMEEQIALSKFPSILGGTAWLTLASRDYA